jgi:PAS domain S-box-containing protein
MPLDQIHDMNENTAAINFQHRPEGFLHLAEAMPGVTYRMELFPFLTLSYVSQNVNSLLGYTPDELLFKESSFYDRFLAAKDLSLLTRKVEEARQSADLHKVTLQLSSRNGIAKEVEDWYVGVFDTGRNLVAIEGYVQEVRQSTSRRRLLNYLKAYRNAIDVNIISSTTDARGIIVHANENFQRISQYTESELVGQNHRIICSGYHPQSFFAELWQTINSGKRWHGEILNRAKDGSLYWVDTVIIPVFDEAGTIRHFLSLRMLITARKQAEIQKDNYVKLLEEIAHMVAHDVRGPVCSIIG